MYTISWIGFVALLAMALAVACSSNVLLRSQEIEPPSSPTPSTETVCDKIGDAERKKYVSESESQLTVFAKEEKGADTSVCAIFVNAGARPVFLNLRSNFQFTLYVRDSGGHELEFDLTPAGESRKAVKSDYSEVRSGSLLALQLKLADKDRLAFGQLGGKMRARIVYASGSKDYFFDDQWEGQLSSSETQLTFASRTY